MSLLSFYESNVHFSQLSNYRCAIFLSFITTIVSIIYIYGVSSCSKQTVSVSHSLSLTTENPIIVSKQNSNLHSLSFSSNQSQFAISSFYYYNIYNPICSLSLPVATNHSLSVLQSSCCKCRESDYLQKSITVCGFFKFYNYNNVVTIISFLSSCTNQSESLCLTVELL